MLRIFPTYPFRVQHSNQITNSVTLLSCRCRTTATESTHTANDPSLNFSVLTLFNLIQCLIGLLLLNIHIYTICTFTVPHPPLSVSIESVEYLNLPPTRPGRRRFASAIPGKQAILHVPTNSNPYQENRHTTDWHRHRRRHIMVPMLCEENLFCLRPSSSSINTEHWSAKFF